MQDPLNADERGSVGTPSIDTDYLYGLLERPSWHAEAACAGMSTEVFFPMRGEGLAEARATCSSCPVRDECREASIAGGEKFGIWGGMSERERRIVRRARNEQRRAQAS